MILEHYFLLYNGEVEVQTPDLINDSLLDSIVEQLRTPLLTIKLMVEAGDTSQLDSITSSSIQLLDDISYVRELIKENAKLDLSPVNIAVLSDDIAHSLSSLAQERNISIETRFTNNRPVLAHRFTLLRAYENMVKGILSMSRGEEASTVILSTSGLNSEVRFGAYSSEVSLTARDLNQMRKLFGASRRPMSLVSTSPVTELYIADKLLTMLGLRLRTAISSRQHGFATTLMPSSQLTLLG